MIGVPVDCINYSQTIAQIRQLAGEDRPSAICAANTHIVTAARRQPDFAAILNRFDLILPDEMPLVWAMNRNGAALKDRVYGPYFMRETLKATPAPYRHSFIGSTESILRQLVPKLRKFQPNLLVSGTCSPPFHPWSESELDSFAQTINDAQPDFIWVALGGESRSSGSSGTSTAPTAASSSPSATPLPFSPVPDPSPQPGCRKSASPGSTGSFRNLADFRCAIWFTTACFWSTSSPAPPVPMNSEQTSRSI